MPQLSPALMDGLRNAVGAVKAPVNPPGWHSKVCARASKRGEAGHNGWVGVPTGTPQRYFSVGSFPAQRPERALASEPGFGPVDGAVFGWRVAPEAGHRFSAGKKGSAAFKRMGDDLQGRL